MEGLRFIQAYLKADTKNRTVGVNPKRYGFCRCSKRSALFLPAAVAGAVHRTALTAASAGGYSFLFIPHQLEDDACYHQDQYKTDQNSGNIFRNPSKHNGRLLSHGKPILLL